MWTFLPHIIRRGKNLLQTFFILFSSQPVTMSLRGSQDKSEVGLAPYHAAKRVYIIQANIESIKPQLPVETGWVTQGILPLTSASRRQKWTKPSILKYQERMTLVTTRQDLLPVLYKSRNHYHFHKSPPPDVAYSKHIPVHNFTLCNVGCILILSGDEIVKSVQ